MPTVRHGGSDVVVDETEGNGTMHTRRWYCPTFAFFGCGDDVDLQLSRDPNLLIIL